VNPCGYSAKSAEGKLTPGKKQVGACGAQETRRLRERKKGSHGGIQNHVGIGSDLRMRRQWPRTKAGHATTTMQASCLAVTVLAGESEKHGIGAVTTDERKTKQTSWISND